MPEENKDSNWNLRGSELLVECYLRLNGYFIVNNFILHKQHGSQETEVDLIGIRFPNQIELIKDDGGHGRIQQLENDAELIGEEKLVDVIIAEVKKGKSGINGPFEKEEVLKYILNWIGCLNGKERVKAIECLKRKEDFRTDDGKIKVRFVCFGGERSEIKCKQITLPGALTFIRGRFKKYVRYKTHSDQWSGVMKYIYDVAESRISNDELLRKILDGEWNLSFKEP